MNKALNIKKKSVAIRLVCVVCAPWFLASCVKDELHNTPHPDRGAVTVSLTGLAADGEYVLDIDGQTAAVTGSSFTFPDLLTPGTYSLVVSVPRASPSTAGWRKSIQGTAGLARTVRPLSPCRVI